MIKSIFFIQSILIYKFAQLVISFFMTAYQTNFYQNYYQNMNYRKWKLNYLINLYFYGLIMIFEKIIIKFMKLIKGLKDIIYKADIFYTGEMLRYQDEPQYRTLIGGVLSLTLVTILIITFYNVIGNTLNKIVINTSTSYSNFADPLSYNITTFENSNFMFGVEIWFQNLNEGPRKFDIVLINNQFATGVDVEENSIQYPLEACTLEHWKSFPDVQKNFNRLNMSFWMCLPLDSTYEIKGKYASQVSRTLQVKVNKCSNNSKYNTRECDSVENIDNFFKQGKQYFTIYFINPLINPNSEQFLSYYLQDNNFIIFTQKFGAEATLFMEGFQIETDQSIWPFTQFQSTSGGIVKQFAIKNAHNTATTDKTYCSISFFKSGIQTKYERSFAKLDQTLAYIGGLFGTVMVFLSLINTYNEYSFEITIGSYLFQGQTKDATQRLKKYNLCHFLAQLLYNLLNIFGVNPEWKTIKQYYNCRQQMLKQLDILYLLKRVLFIQKSIEILFDQHELNSLYFHQKMSFQQAAKKRKKHKLTKIFLKNKQKKGVEHGNQRQLKKENILQTLNQMNNDILIKSKTKKLSQHLQRQQTSEINQIINGHQLNISIMPQKKIYPDIKQTRANQQYDNNFMSSDSQIDEQQENDYQDSLIKLKEQTINRQDRKIKIWANIDQNIRKQIEMIYQQNSIVKYTENLKQQLEIHRQQTMVEDRLNNQSQSNIIRQNSFELPSQACESKLKTQNIIQPYRYRKAKPQQILLNNKSLKMQEFQQF